MLDRAKFPVIIRWNFFRERESRIADSEVFVMICATVKAGAECGFMTKAGCGFNGGSCHQIVEQCEGCQRITELPAGRYCNSYPNPSLKWKTSMCNFATHAKQAAQTQQAKVNPIKASKRGSGKKK